jgi:hypothetical protein
MKKHIKYMVGDFETTVYDGQTFTEVWASAVVELGSEDVKIHHSIRETYNYLYNLRQNICIYYHNLKFDGSFWLSFLLTDLKYEQKIYVNPNNDRDVHFLKEKDLTPKSFVYSISDMGQWYSILIKTPYALIEIRDSLKLLPFSVEEIAKSFDTKHKKLKMEYTGLRYAGCPITDDEKRYIANDVLVVKEALEIMQLDGHLKLTIGSCCLSEFKSTIDKQDYQAFFPDLTQFKLNPLEYKYSNADEYIRHSYRGGWCYLKRGCENRIYTEGITADVNSLYPSMMHSESGNYYPYGQPVFFKGKIPPKCLTDQYYYFVRIRTRFYLKENKLPFIQIKGSFFYKATEMLETSDIVDKDTGNVCPWYKDFDGNIKKAIVEMVLTQTDFELLQEHYNLLDFELLDGCYFRSITGIFDEYINKYKKIKQNSTGARRTLAKLFLNNLYGKLSSSDISSFKVAREKDDGSLGFTTYEEHEKKVMYIPIGSAITSYARNFTIRAAQQNYKYFVYADTDSIHCCTTKKNIKGIKIHPSNFCCWKLESFWNEAIFVRQKTYIEHVTHEDEEPINEPYYNVKCAGMPDRCKNLFLKSMEGVTDDELEKYPTNQQEFLKTKRTLADFKEGMEVYGKLRPVRIRGGIVLQETTYKMR